MILIAFLHFAELNRLLNENGLSHLQTKFVSAGVDADNVWDLDDVMLDEAGLTTAEKSLYREAKPKLDRTITSGILQYIRLE